MSMKFITCNSCAGPETSACPQQISPIQRADFADKVSQPRARDAATSQATLIPNRYFRRCGTRRRRCAALGSDSPRARSKISVGDVAGCGIPCPWLAALCRWLRAPGQLRSKPGAGYFYRAQSGHAFQSGVFPASARTV